MTFVYIRAAHLMLTFISIWCSFWLLPTWSPDCKNTRLKLLRINITLSLPKEISTDTSLNDDTYVSNS